MGEAKGIYKPTLGFLWERQALNLELPALSSVLSSPGHTVRDTIIHIWLQDTQKLWWGGWQACYSACCSKASISIISWPRTAWRRERAERIFILGLSNWCWKCFSDCSRSQSGQSQSKNPSSRPFLLWKYCNVIPHDLFSPESFCGVFGSDHCILWFYWIYMRGVGSFMISAPGADVPQMPTSLQALCCTRHRHPNRTPASRFCSLGEKTEAHKGHYLAQGQWTRNPGMHCPRLCECESKQKVVS